MGIVERLSWSFNTYKFVTSGSLNVSLLGWEAQQLDYSSPLGVLTVEYTHAIAFQEDNSTQQSELSILSTLESI